MCGMPLQARIEFCWIEIIFVRIGQH